MVVLTASVVGASAICIPICVKVSFSGGGGPVFRDSLRNKTACFFFALLVQVLHFFLSSSTLLLWSVFAAFTFLHIFSQTLVFELNVATLESFEKRMGLFLSTSSKRIWSSASVKLGFLFRLVF